MQNSWLVCYWRVPGKLTENSKFEDMEGLPMSRDHKNKLDQALQAKQESEAKVASLEEKLALYEQANVDLKDKVCTVC